MSAVPIGRSPKRARRARQRDLKQALVYIRERQEQRMHGRIVLHMRAGRIVRAETTNGVNFDGDGPS